MPTDDSLTAYQKDSRVACQYGEKCYQKNPAHHDKYKHPPKISKPNDDNKNTKGLKHQFTSASSSSSSDNDDKITDESKKIIPESSDEESDDSSNDLKTESSVTTTQVACTSESSTKEDKIPENKAIKSYDTLNPHEKLIQDLFLVQMPDDFYKFYEFCSTINSKNPQLALQSIDLELVGPFDVLSGKITEPKNDKDIYLTHWRYFYDPPEFQTILKGNDKEGLHYGYWRDEPNEQPPLVAKNLANIDCKIVACGPNIFAAVLAHTEEVLKKANLFTKPKILQISQKLKSFAKENNIFMEKLSTEMKTRNRKVVAKTFFGIGIVVKYDTKTQLGYRTLSATESQFKKILSKIENPSTDAEKIENLSAVEEIVRWATIAADECDFGTPLELGHDLFASGVGCLEKTSLQMLRMAYSLLRRSQFSKIAEVHIKNRKKGCQLSVL
ncbi:histone PARylation factor 1 isoform X2 [Aphidius gifuensis]|uniref:histone PARylation factor 1 isoform X2 n=1 Tax=Aphidius gifuensis TaxID=684658 RepID=UPI001CDD38B1|nr:histone PARylation factor 1 isoform X2 [Aphidius gifuensis]